MPPHSLPADIISTLRWPRLPEALKSSLVHETDSSVENSLQMWQPEQEKTVGAVGETDSS